MHQVLGAMYSDAVHGRKDKKVTTATVLILNQDHHGGEAVLLNHKNILSGV